jgi:hypothetical protein
VARITTPGFLLVAPTSGPAGTAVTLSGGGLDPGEGVLVRYDTGVRLCKTTADALGSFSCHGTIPTTGAGAPGAHVIQAVGRTSVIRVRATFTLT